MHPNDDFDMNQALPLHHRDLVQDFGLHAVFRVMAQEDAFVRHVVERALLLSLEEVEAIRYRQAVLKDVLKNPSFVRAMYALAVETLEKRKRGYFFGVMARHPSSTLMESLDLLQMLFGMLQRLRDEALRYRDGFASEGFQTFFSMLEDEVSDQYLEQVRAHLAELKFRNGIVVSARLGKGLKGVGYVLNRPEIPHHWMRRLVSRRSPGFSFQIADRDEAGARAVSELYDRGINDVANALAQSTDHVLKFFSQLRTELAFYVGCLNLFEAISQVGNAFCFPDPFPYGEMVLAFRDLRYLPLVLSQNGPVVGNDLDADAADLIVVTGANHGGKTTFLRSIGVAHLMMQCGMFVLAEQFRAHLACGFYTHFKREEDVALESGKFDEELARMSDIVDHVAPRAMVLLNESFAATNEREGSDVAESITLALVESHVTVVFVTHLHALAENLHRQGNPRWRFLRAERLVDGTRTFKLTESPPLETSFGVDLYDKVFMERNAVD